MRLDRERDKPGRQLPQQRSGLHGVHLILHGNVRPECLPVLPRQPSLPGPGKRGPQGGQLRRSEREGDAAAQRAKPGDRDWKRCLVLAQTAERRRDLAGLGRGQMVEQGQMSVENIAVRREVRGTQPVEPGLVAGCEREREDQRRRVEEWFELTRRVLPAMAEAQFWPIRFGHCFMRVLLDNAFGGVWHRFIKRPAIRHISPDRLDQAIALGRAVRRAPALLPELNRRSLGWRRHGDPHRPPV